MDDENDVIEIDETERITPVPTMNNILQQRMSVLTQSILTADTPWVRQRTLDSPRRYEYLQAVSLLRRVDTMSNANVMRRIHHSAQRISHILQSRYPTETHPHIPDFRLLDLQYVLGRHFTFDNVQTNDVIPRPRGFAIVDDVQTTTTHFPFQRLRRMAETTNMPYIMIARRNTGRTHEIRQMMQQYVYSFDEVENTQPITNQQLSDFHRASQRENNQQQTRIDNVFHGDNEIDMFPQRTAESAERQMLNRVRDLLWLRPSPQIIYNELRREFDGDEMNIFFQQSFKKHANYADYCILCETPNSENDEHPECSICLENYQPTDVCVLANFCGHIFHRQCLEKWIDERDECPLCRQNMLKKQQQNDEHRETTASVVNGGEWHGLFLEEVD